MKKTTLILLFIVLAVIGYSGFIAIKRHNSIPPTDSFPSPSVKPDLLLLQTKGIIKQTGDNLLILSNSGSGNDYILEGTLSEEMAKHKNKEFDVIGKVIPINPIIVNSRPINAKIQVIAFGDKLIPMDKTSSISAPLLEVFQQKIDAKRQLREKIIKKFKKDDAFEIAKGRIVAEMRDVPGKGLVEHITLMTDDGDAFLLTGKAVKSLQSKFATLAVDPIVILGMETLPAKGHLLKTGETTFVVQEAYTESLEPIK